MQLSELLTNLKKMPSQQQRKEHLWSIGFSIEQSVDFLDAMLPEKRVQCPQATTTQI
jgi:hypothetical protein